MATKKAAKKKAAPKRPRGRPSKKTPAVCQEIVDRLSAGEPLAQICRDEHMPHPSVVRDWQGEDEEFSRAVARAREVGYDRMAAECLEIADDARNDWMERQTQGGETIEVFNREAAQRSKLRIETRLKLLACWDPKRYGNRQTIEHDISDNMADKLKAARERAAKR